MRLEKALALRPGHQVTFRPKGYSARRLCGDLVVFDDLDNWEWPPLGQVLRVTPRGSVLLAVLGRGHTVKRTEWKSHRHILEFVGRTRHKLRDGHWNDYGY